MATPPRTPEKEPGHEAEARPVDPPDAEADPDASSAARAARRGLTVLEGALYTAFACAVLSAFSGNRAAWVLVGSVSYCLYLDVTGVPFNVIRWLILDVSSMALIAALTLPKLTLANSLIFGLFFVGWAAYALPDPHRYTISVSVTIAQLLLTFPVANFRERLRSVRQAPDRWNEFDLRAAHGEAGG